jgi:hypothetical protein
MRCAARTQCFVCCLAVRASASAMKHMRAALLGRRRCLQMLRVYVLNLLQIILVGSGGTLGGWVGDEWRLGRGRGNVSGEDEGGNRTRILVVRDMRP